MRSTCNNRLSVRRAAAWGAVVFVLAGAAVAWVGAARAEAARVRTYPVHTRIVATTFWVGEQFQATDDGSQVCSAYDSQWQLHHFGIRGPAATTPGCTGSLTGGCDARLTDPAGPCDDTNAVASLRTPANGYFPRGLARPLENPFYLDLPYDDFNASDDVDTTARARRCLDVPWKRDPGYRGHCNDPAFSFMKNRWVRISTPGRTCFGQVEDAGPADDGHGNGNYADRRYVFGRTDARPANRSYGGAGMDVSPALNACLGGMFNESLVVAWRFVEAGQVPARPYRVVTTTLAPTA